MPVTIDTIRAAADRIGDAIYHTPCPYSLALSRACDAQVYCKLDHLQMTGSFKERGARNKLLLLKGDTRSTGSALPAVIAASAGNHALGLSYHGQLLGIPVTVVMPKWAPLVKVSNCRALGANVILHGESYDEAKQHALELARERNLSYIPGFDDPDIIAGQGTVGLEILADVPDLDAVIVPIGGGGLIAGIGTVIKALRPQARVIGVEPRNAPTMHESLRAGRVMKIATQPTLADGLAVAEAGQLCFDIARQVVDDIMLVDEAQIALSVLRLLELEKMVIEGAGAATLAAAMNKSMNFSSKKIVLCLSGGNIDVTIISRIIERGLAIDGRLCRIIARIADRPGSLAKLTTVIASTGASVKEVDHDRYFAPADIGFVNVICLLETRDAAHIREVQEALKGAGIECRDASSLL